MAVRKTKKGLALKRWFKENWVDVKTGKPCGRRKGEKRGTPYCRPKKRISSKTPKTASELTSKERSSRIAQKNRLGQPAGKPRRVKSLKRQNKKRGGVISKYNYSGKDSARRMDVNCAYGNSPYLQYN